jgi:hypothetical protein
VRSTPLKRVLHKGQSSALFLAIPSRFLDQLVRGAGADPGTSAVSGILNEHLRPDARALCRLPRPIEHLLLRPRGDDPSQEEDETRDPDGNEIATIIGH